MMTAHAFCAAFPRAAQQSNQPYSLKKKLATQFEIICEPEFSHPSKKNITSIFFYKSFPNNFVTPLVHLCADEAIQTDNI